MVPMQAVLGGVLHWREVVCICLFSFKHCSALTFPEIAVCSENWNSALLVRKVMVLWEAGTFPE